MRIIAFLLLVSTSAALGSPRPEPPDAGGLVAIDRLLTDLSDSRRVLVIGAHPDDEDNRLLAVLDRGRGLDVGYLSLTRGEGGQNLIGDELGFELGLLRSRELLAARAIDGAEQFFTRAIDFGFTRDMTETWEKWPRAVLLEDILEVFREFRPDVIVSIFEGSVRDGHGHHRAAALLAREAFDLTVDWEVRPQKFYVSALRDRDNATLVIPTSGLDRMSGRSWHQIAMESRSQHRCQDMGQLEEIGPQWTALRLISSRVKSPDVDIMSGIPETDPAARIASGLRSTLANPQDLFQGLLAATRDDNRFGPALAMAAGLIVDARAQKPLHNPGEKVDTQMTIWNAGISRVRVLSHHLSTQSPQSVGASGQLSPGESFSSETSLPTHADAESTPRYLRLAPAGFLYQLHDEGGGGFRGAIDPPPLEVIFDVEIEDVPVRLAKEVTHRFRDQALGEIRSPIVIVPSLEVQIEPASATWVDDAPRTVTLKVRNNDDGPRSGQISVLVEGGSSIEARRFDLGPGEESVRAITISPGDLEQDSVSTLKAVAVTDSGDVFGSGLRSIDYPHIRPVHYLRDATSLIRRTELARPELDLIGYVRGAADRIPESLTSIGLPIEVLEPQALGDVNLDRFDAVVVGPRAFETNPALGENNDHLLDYARRGGLVLVQYQQYGFVAAGHAPKPFSIAQPHDRITDETAPVRVLIPEHPIFHHPNPIRDDDWQGWPQERGLYFAHEWDPTYSALLEMTDENGQALQGSLLLTAVGEGSWVYTGLSFFRSIPVGTPGALRLFLNLLALGESP